MPAPNIPDAAWRKSSYSSQQGSCVEVAFLGAEGDSSLTNVALRDTKDRGGPVLTFQAGDWRAFVTGIRSGDFRLS